MGFIISRKQCNIDKIPWYRDITLYNEELIIGKVCLECGEIVGTNHSQVIRHKKCQMVYRRRRQEETRQRKKSTIKPKYCVDCGELMRESTWNISNSTRCLRCQYEFTLKNAKPNKEYRGYTVAVTCVLCGEIVLTKYSSTKYCKKCGGESMSIPNDDTSISIKETNSDKYFRRSRQLKEYNKKLYPRMMLDKKYEKPGTYDTYGKYGQYPTNELAKDKDGNPNFDKEQELVSHIKKNTFSSRKYKKRSTIPREGDLIRNPKLINRLKTYAKE